MTSLDETSTPVDLVAHYRAVKARIAARQAPVQSPPPQAPAPVPAIAPSAKRKRAPRNRNASGYGRNIPTDYMVKLDRGPRSQWQRVYAICYSNAASHYIRANAAGERFLDADCFERIEALIAQA
jgi:hypothetical protein